MKIKKFYSDKSKWCQGTGFRNKKGQSCASKDFQSCCLVGAVYKFYPNKSKSIINLIERELKNTNQESLLSIWNDDPKREFKDVKDLVTKLNI